MNCHAPIDRGQAKYSWHHNKIWRGSWPVDDISSFLEVGGEKSQTTAWDGEKKTCKQWDKLLITGAGFLSSRIPTQMVDFLWL